MSKAKGFYRKLSEKEESIPLFSKAWWLDAMCGNMWEVVDLKQDGEFSVLLPYYKTSKLLFSMIKQPPLTQAIAPWFFHEHHQADDLIRLLNTLPKVDRIHLHIAFSPSDLNKIAKDGYVLSERVTYLIESKTEEQAFKNLDGNTRRLIQKAVKTLSVREDLSFEVFYEVLRKSFARKEMEVPHSFESLKKLDLACQEHNCRKMLFSLDAENNIHSVMYLVWDNKKVYYLLGGIDPLFRKSGGQSLLIWEGIKWSLSQGKVFDFEGSMIPSIASFFRSFGAEPASYSELHKENSSLLRLFTKLKKRFF